MTGVLFIGCGPGPSGADSMARALLGHPDIHPAGNSPPRLLEAIATLIAGIEDSAEYLPREAGLAVRNFEENLRSHLELTTADTLLGTLRENLTEGVVQIEAYGGVPLVPPRSRPEIISILNSSLVAAFDGFPGAFALDKHGPSFSYRALRTELATPSKAVWVIRDPLDVALHLVESPTVPRNVDDAVRFINLCFEPWIGCEDANDIVVKLETLVATPQSSLAELADKLGVEPYPDWIATAVQSIPESLHLPDMPSSTEADLAAALAPIREALTYTDG